MTVWMGRREWRIGWVTGRRLVVGALIVALAVAGFLLSGGRVYVYNDLNAGVVLSAPYGCVGLEVKGAPGFFGGLDPGVCDI
jgi:hypothetical protein